MSENRRLAVFTIDCFETGAAVQDLAKLLKSELAVIVESDTPRRTSVMSERGKRIRQAGVPFVAYMFLNFKVYEWTCRLLRLIQGENAPTKTVRAWCQDNGVPCYTCRDVNSKETREELRRFGVTHILVYGFDQVVRSALIDEFSGRIVNVHPARLPDYKGPFPVFWAFMRGEPRTGVSLHRIIDESLDTGPVLRQIEMDFDPSSDALCSARMISVAGADMVFDALQKGVFCESGTPQGFSGTYFTYPTRAEMKQLDPTRRVASISSFFREVMKAKRDGVKEPA